MSIVITMAGNGTRFQKAGYMVPKYQIVTKNKSLFAWSLQSLGHLFSSMPFIFVVKKSDLASEFIKHQCQLIGIKVFHILEIDALTNGQATTAKTALPYCEPNELLGIYNIDTFVDDECIALPSSKFDGYIPCFTPLGDHWSFVKVNEHGSAVEVKEKTRISDFATIGLYWFRNPQEYLDAYLATYSDHRQMVNGEAYIAPMYNSMISEGKNVGIHLIPNDKVHALGTPDEVSAFEKSYHR